MQSWKVSTPCILPFEIIETIIDSLAGANDTDSLKTTSLVCQSVLPRCRKHLFFSIVIQEYNAFHAEKCRTLLSPQTDIAKYIRRLQYESRSGSALPTIYPPFLERIPFLQSLTIRDSNDWIRGMDPSLRSALVNLMHLPTLTHLHLFYIYKFPILDLSSCTSLKHLQLDYVGVTDESPYPSEADIFTVPRIQEYTACQCSRTTMKLLTAKLGDGRLALDFTNLKMLSVELETNEDVEVTRCLLKESKQVEELRVRATDAGLTSLSDMAFHTFGTILCFSLDSWEFETPPGIVFGLYNEISAMATANNTLKTLRLDIHSDYALNIVSNGEWEKLDAVLSSSGWPCLEHISLHITTFDYGTSTEQLKLLTDLPNTRLTGLSSRRLLDFKVTVEKLIS